MSQQTPAQNPFVADQWPLPPAPRVCRKTIAVSDPGLQGTAGTDEAKKFFKVEKSGDATEINVHGF